jgi:hypothetical protein
LEVLVDQKLAAEEMAERSKTISLVPKQPVSSEIGSCEGFEKTEEWL